MKINVERLIGQQLDWAEGNKMSISSVTLRHSPSLTVIVCNLMHSSRRIRRKPKFVPRYSLRIKRVMVVKSPPMWWNIQINTKRRAQ